MFKNEPWPHVVLFCVLGFTELVTGFIMEFAGKYRVVFFNGLQIPFVCVRVNLN